ncbi:MAG: homoserine dehydrogenase [Cryomorphaceae bacterium]|nr:homoserine dehydrogenase [Cryomorphaceae bacterium]
MKKLNIALIGFGTAGRGFYEAWQQLGTTRFNIHGVAVKDGEKERYGLHLNATTDVLGLINDPTVDVVVEATGNVKEAKLWYDATIKNRQVFVTANKQLVSQLNAFGNQNLLYEASCGGALPIVRLLETCFPHGVSSIRGVLNGSTNYILTRIFVDGFTFNDGLLIAKEAGFVEADERLDLDGGDPATKLRILCRHAFGLRLHADDVSVFPLIGFNDVDVKFIRRNNLVVRYIATATVEDGKITARVAPELVAAEHPFAKVLNEENAVSITDRGGESYFFKAKGAGKQPTGTALFNDLEAWSQGFRYKKRKLAKAKSTPEIEEVIVRTGNDFRSELTDAETIESWVESGQRFYRLRCCLNELARIPNVRSGEASVFVVGKDLTQKTFKPEYHRLEC